MNVAVNLPKMPCGIRIKKLSSDDWDILIDFFDLLRNCYIIHLSDECITVLARIEGSRDKQSVFLSFDELTAFMQVFDFVQYDSVNKKVYDMLTGLERLVKSAYNFGLKRKCQ